MTDREQFLAAIIASPQDDLPRLVYADWLEEQGQVERAEFIRRSIEFGVWETRTHGQITNPHPDATISAIWVRGFVFKLHGTLAGLLSIGPAICREHPVESVEVTDHPPQFMAQTTGTWGIMMGDLQTIRGSMMSYGFSSAQAATDNRNVAILATIRERAKQSDTMRVYGVSGDLLGDGEGYNYSSIKAATDAFRR